MSFLRRIFGRDVKTDTAVQNGYTLVADDTKTSGLDWSDVLMRGGLGRDLATGINNVDFVGSNIDAISTPGEYYFGTNTSGTKPSTYGLLKVWRESLDAIYQIVQSSDEANNKMFSRCYRNGTWGPWTEYANTPSMPSLSGYATETYVNNALPLPAVLMGSVGSPSTFGGNTISSRYIKFHIVSPGGGGGGGHQNAYQGPGGLAGNSGMAVDILYIRNLGEPYTVSISIGVAGVGGAAGDFNNPPTDGQAGGNVTIDIDGIPIVVYGGKGGKKGGGSEARGAPTPRSEPTINDNTVYAGGVYTFGNGTFIIENIYHSYTSYGATGDHRDDPKNGIGRKGVSPMTSHTGESTPVPGVSPVTSLTGEGTPVPSPQSAPSTAIGTSGAGGISEYGGYIPTAGGTGGPGMVIVYR